MIEFLLILILIIAVLIYLNLRLKILPLAQANNLAFSNFSKRYAEVDFIVPQLKNDSYSLKKNVDFVSENILIGRLGLCQSFQVMAFCMMSELSKGIKFFEGSIVVTQFENFSQIPTVNDGDIVHFVVLKDNIFELQIKCSQASFDELRNQFLSNQDTTLRLLAPYFKKQNFHQHTLGGAGVSINSINNNDYGDSVYDRFLKKYQSSNDDTAHDLMYKSISELMIIRRKSQTQFREEAENLVD